MLRTRYQTQPNLALTKFYTKGAKQKSSTALYHRNLERKDSGEIYEITNPDIKLSCLWNHDRGLQHPNPTSNPSF